MHGGLALISKHGFQVEPDLVVPLAIEPGTQLWGIHYRPPDGGANPAYQNVRYPDDFMLTPIPLEAWCYAARLRVRVRNEPGQLHSVTDCLRRNGVSLLSGELNRSGHRYSTIQVVADFEGLRADFEAEHDKNELISNNELRLGIEAIVGRVRQEMEQRLFQDDTIPDLKNPIEFDPLGGLSYFGRYLHERRKTNPKLAVVFEANYEHGMLECKDNAFRDVLALMEIEDLPTYCFAEMNPDGMNVRFVLIPRKDLDWFRELQVSYKATETTRGLLSAISKPLAQSHNIWRLSSRQHGTKSVHQGTLTLYIEDHRRSQHHDAKLRDAIRKCAPDSIDITDVKLRPLRPYKVFISIKEELPSRDDYISRCTTIAKELGIKTEVVSTNINSATSMVCERLASCQGIVQFYFGAEEEPFIWLQAEFLAAEILGIPCVRFVDPKHQHKIQIARDTPNVVIPHNAGQSAIDDRIRNAFKELVKEMMGRPNNLRPFG